MTGTSRSVAAALAFTGSVAAIAATVTGFVLTDIYVPRPRGGASAGLSDRIGRSDPWSSWHRVAGAVLVVAAVAVLALAIFAIARGRAATKQRVLLIGVGFIAALMGLVTVITGPLVEWDQLALWSVSVGRGIDGYWTAAFGEEVRFVLMEDAEVSKGAYRAALIAHLAAPVVAATALLILGVALSRGRSVETATLGASAS